MSNNVNTRPPCSHKLMTSREMKCKWTLAGADGVRMNVCDGQEHSLRACWKIPMSSTEWKVWH